MMRGPDLKPFSCRGGVQRAPKARAAHRRLDGSRSLKARRNPEIPDGLAAFQPLRTFLLSPKAPVSQGLREWSVPGSNQRPGACKFGLASGQEGSAGGEPASFLARAQVEGVARGREGSVGSDRESDQRRTRVDRPRRRRLVQLAIRSQTAAEELLRELGRSTNRGGAARWPHPRVARARRRRRVVGDRARARPRRHGFRPSRRVSRRPRRPRPPLPRRRAGRRRAARPGVSRARLCRSPPAGLVPVCGREYAALGPTCASPGLKMG